LGLKELFAYVFPENKASIRVLEKNRMKKIEEVNEYHKMYGVWVKDILFSVTSSDYHKTVGH
jgi:RimJ/RimL family protein N-acetyltransferase